MNPIKKIAELEVNFLEAKYVVNCNKTLYEITFYNILKCKEVNQILFMYKSHINSGKML